MSLGKDTDPGLHGTWALVGCAGCNSSSTAGWWAVRQAQSATAGGTTHLGLSASPIAVPLRGAPGPVHVYAAGLNVHGELALGDTGSRTRFSRSAALGQLTLKDMAFGGAHSLALGEDGRLWCAGSNAHGQCAPTGAVPSPQGVRLAGLPAGSGKVALIAAGAYHSLALGEDGRLWAVGLNAHGECGQGHTDAVSVWTEVALPSGGKPGRIVGLAAAATHSVVRTAGGQAFVFGANHNNQCGVIRGSGAAASNESGAQCNNASARAPLIARPTVVGNGRCFSVRNVSAVAAADTFTVLVGRHDSVTTWNDTVESILERERTVFDVGQSSVSKISTYSQVVFVIDTSGSMRASFTRGGQTLTRMAFVQKELETILTIGLRSVQQFSLIRYNSRISQFPAAGVMAASPENVKRAVVTVQTWTGFGGTYTYSALKKAFALSGTQAIYLLSDGSPSSYDGDPSTILTDVATWRKAMPIPVHTIAFMSGGAESDNVKNTAAAFMQDLATQTGGDYQKYV